LRIKPTDTLNSNFIGITTLHVSGSLSAHHQEFLAVHRDKFTRNLSQCTVIQSYNCTRGVCLYDPTQTTGWCPAFQNVKSSARLPHSLQARV